MIGGSSTDRTSAVKGMKPYMIVSNRQIDRSKCWLKKIFAAAALNTRNMKTWKVLDAGCGNGSITFPIASFVSNVTGIDVSAPMIESARENQKKNGATNITFIQDDDVGFDMRYEDKFNMIIFSRSIHDSKNIQNTLQIANDNLANDGILIIMEPTEKSRFGDVKLQKRKNNKLFDEKIYQEFIAKLNRTRESIKCLTQDSANWEIVFENSYPLFILVLKKVSS